MSKMTDVYGKVLLTKKLSLLSTSKCAFSPVLQLDNHELLASRREESSSITESKLSNTDER